MVCDLLDHREVLLGGVEVVHCHLVHCYVHDWAVGPVPRVVPREVRLAYLRCLVRRPNSYDSAVLLLYFLVCLENWRQ